MIVSTDLPDIYSQIIEVFPAVKGRKVIMAWDSTIYNPFGAEMTEALHAHEEVHGCRQKGDPEAWWQRYLKDRDFRIEEERQAHAMEYIVMCYNYPKRHQRRRALTHIAKKLASPLYGSMVSLPKARAMINITVKRGVEV